MNEDDELDREIREKISRMSEDELDSTLLHYANQGLLVDKDLPKNHPLRIINERARNHPNLVRLIKESAKINPNGTKEEHYQYIQQRYKGENPLGKKDIISCLLPIVCFSFSFYRQFGEKFIFNNRVADFLISFFLLYFAILLGSAVIIRLFSIFSGSRSQTAMEQAVSSNHYSGEISKSVKPNNLRMPSAAPRYTPDQPEYYMPQATNNDSPVCMYSGGGGESFEDAIVINCRTTHEGISAEYEWIESRYGKRDVDWKTVQRMHGIESDNKIYEQFNIELSSGGERKIIFDVTSFYGEFKFG